MLERILQPEGREWNDPVGDWETTRLLSDRLERAASQFTIPQVVDFLAGVWNLPECEVADALRAIHYGAGWIRDRNDWAALSAYGLDVSGELEVAKFREGFMACLLGGMP